MKIAMLIRVSTEQQEKHGESLANQESVLRKNIEILESECIPYIGQEHATPDNNRQLLNMLMNDAKSGKFQAIMVYDPSRWSRDNGKSREYLDILRDLNIKFYCGLQEYDLWNEQDRLFLHLSTEFNEFAARQTKRKSLESRIHRAERGIPVTRNPFGRIWDKKTSQWKIDVNKQKLIEEIANRYLNEDVSWRTLGKEYGINPAFLNKTICNDCGDTWNIHFNVSQLKINKIVKMKIPRLLDERIIERIQTKSAQRKSWDRITSKNDYLFAKLIFDKDTQFSLFGCSNSRKMRYYRSTNIKPNYSINADKLEKAIINELFDTLGNQKSLMQAVFDGNPLIKVQEDLLHNISIKQKLLIAIDKKIENIISAIEKSGYSDIFEKRLDSLKKEQADIIKDIETFNNQLVSLPTSKDIQDAALSLRELLKRGVRKSIVKSYVNSGVIFHHLPFKEKRKIISIIFGGYDENKKRYGIYVKCVKWENPREFEIEAYGRIGKIISILKEDYTNGQCIEKPEINQAIGEVIIENNKDMLYEDCTKKIDMADAVQRAMAGQ